MANAFYFLMIISWEQLSLGLEVNVDIIPVLPYKLTDGLGFFLCSSCLAK